MYTWSTHLDPPRRQRRRGRGTNGKPNGNNSGTAADEADDLGEDLQASLECHATLEGILEDLDPDDLFEGAANNYMPKSEDDTSLDPDDYIVPVDPFEQERFQRRLIATARSMKCKQQLLQANTDALNEKWIEVLSVEQDLKERCRSGPKSYPRRRLLSKLDDE